MENITKEIFKKRIEEAKRNENELFLITFDILLSYLNEAIYEKSIDALRNADNCLDKIIEISNYNKLSVEVFVFCKQRFVKNICKEEFIGLKEVYTMIEKFKNAYNIKLNKDDKNYKYVTYNRRGDIKGY